ncbi:ABC transporter substrate-binding protein [Conexibacter sp. CPCC 205706]|uniref:ABC transporter substrate-binding protein n=2 Tax=Conexibacter TaxID=191494 RepID=UPI00271BBDB2|nr:ABC transporter substrate-binding protein [Conexibacter sp. CPCC 205706]MDO8201465.1 ABC transporter substrate-binding protein [Conexibacter sp. CPCC 205762]
MVGRASVALMAAAATFAVAGCGSSDDSSSGTSANGGDGSASGKKITLVTGVKGDEFYITMACGAQREADRLGVQLDVQSPDEFDPSKQTPIVNAVAAAKPDALLIAPTDQSALYAPIKQIADAGSKIVLVDTTLENSDVAVSQIATDNRAGGKEAARALADLIGGSGKVLLLGFRAGVSTDDLRGQGFREGAEELGLELVGTEYSDNKPEKAASIVKAALARDPDLKGVFATNSFASEGAATGLREADAQDQVRIVGFDAGPVQVDQLRQNLVQALIAQQSAEIGRLGVEQAVNALEGRAVEARIGTGSTTITRDNIDSPEARAAMDKREC